MAEPAGPGGTSPYGLGAGYFPYRNFQASVFRAKMSISADEAREKLQSLP